MRRVVTFSVLLIAGLSLSQVLPQLTGDAHGSVSNVIRVATMTGLAFIMIHVGFEFHIDKSNLRQYGWDYFVAFTAATFPWIFATGYFIFVMLPSDVWGSGDAWTETLLAGRFAAPTSAGVLFSMLAAAGLAGTWLFRKIRILAIFDDLDTVLLMIPLKMLIVGIAWQLGLIVVFMVGLLMLGYVLLHRVEMPVSWRWVLAYSAAIVAVSEILYSASKLIDASVPIHIEVLLPAFVLGCIARPKSAAPKSDAAKSDEHSEAPAAAHEQLHHLLERPVEQRAGAWVAAMFMLLVGLSLPQIFEGDDSQQPAPTTAALQAAAPAASVEDPELHGGDVDDRYVGTITASQPSLSWAQIAVHVLVLSAFINVGKMFPVLCYRNEAHWKHRLAIAVGMWPRGEVGAGVLVLSLSYGIGGPIVTVAMLSLALNLLLTGLFIIIVKRLLGTDSQPVAETVNA